MKIYNLKGTVKWNKRVKILTPILVFLIVNLLFIPFLYFVLSESADLLRSILTSLVVSLLATFDAVYSQVLKYEEKTVVIDDKKIYLIIKQRETDFYGFDIKRKIDIDLSDKKVIDDILKNQNKYLGISLFKADNYDIIKISDDKVSLKMNGKYTKWIHKRKKKEEVFILDTKDKKFNIQIDDKYDNYKELIKYFKGKEK